LHFLINLQIAPIEAKLPRIPAIIPTISPTLRELSSQFNWDKLQLHAESQLLQLFWQSWIGSHLNVDWFKIDFEWQDKQVNPFLHVLQSLKHGKAS